MSELPRWTWILALEVVAMLSLAARQAPKSPRAGSPPAVVSAHVARGEDCGSCHGEQAATTAARHPDVDGSPIACSGACHGPDSLRPDLLRAAPAEVCGACHERPADAGEHPHPAVARGACTACHDPHLAARPHLLRGDTDGDLCMSCHSGMRTRGPDGHAPAEAGLCLLCHGAHGGPGPRDTLYEMPMPCVGCHTDVLPADTTLHSAIPRFGCTGCHDPHWAPGPRQLKAYDGLAVCMRCHEDDATGRKVFHFPVAEGVCTLCHSPHGTGMVANLRAERTPLCAQCHPEKVAPKKTPHPALELGCTAVCHDPHASDNHGRLQQGVVETCTTCHVGYQDGKHVVLSVAGTGHPIDKRPDPWRPGRNVECTSCHNPHGSDNPRMWYFATSRLELCAQCHTQSPVPPNPRFVEWKTAQLAAQAVRGPADPVAPGAASAGGSP